MKITRIKGSNKATGLCKLRFNGDLTIATADTAKSVLDPMLESYSRFKVDLERVNDIDTAGVQLLLLLNRKAQQSGSSLEIICLSKPVHDVLTMIRLADYFETI